MSQGARRSWIIEADVTDGVYTPYDRERALQTVADLMATLDAVGGMFAVTARRVEVPGPPGMTLAETVGIVIEWKLVSPLERLPKDEPAVDAAEEPEPQDDPEYTDPLDDDGVWADGTEPLSEEPDESEVESAIA